MCVRFVGSLGAVCPCLCLALPSQAESVVQEVYVSEQGLEGVTAVTLDGDGVADTDAHHEGAHLDGGGVAGGSAPNRSGVAGDHDPLSPGHQQQGCVCMRVHFGGTVQWHCAVCVGLCLCAVCMCVMCDV